MLAIATIGFGVHLVEQFYKGVVEKALLGDNLHKSEPLSYSSQFQILQFLLLHDHSEDLLEILLGSVFLFYVEQCLSTLSANLMLSTFQYFRKG